MALVVVLILFIIFAPITISIVALVKVNGLKYEVEALRRRRLQQNITPILAGGDPDAGIFPLVYIAVFNEPAILLGLRCKKSQPARCWFQTSRWPQSGCWHPHGR